MPGRPHGSAGRESPLRRARKARNWTLERLVEEIDLRTPGGHSGVTPSMVPGWELGRHTTSTGYRAMLCEIFHQPLPSLTSHEAFDCGVALGPVAAARLLDHGRQAYAAARPVETAAGVSALVVLQERSPRSPATAGFGVAYRGLHGTDERVDLASIPPVQAAYHQALLALLRAPWNLPPVGAA